jgi:glycosyltransferase involved in cell wall biosynthesis
MSVRRSGHRVQLLATGLGVGGAETQVKLTARMLAARGWQIEIVSMIEPPVSIPELANSSIPVHSLKLKPGQPNPLGILRLSRHIRRFRPHVLHCHMVHANLLGRISRLFSSVPVVISTAHSVWEGPRWRDWAYRITDPLSDVTSNVSRAGLKRYVQERMIDRSKAVWLPNGVDLSDFRPDRFDRTALRGAHGWNGRFVWLAVGNLREPKDYPNLLEAFRQVAATRNDRLLAIAGTGPLEAELRRMAEGMGISHAVQWLGQRADVPQLLAAADAYVISSSWEGTPMALLEAASSSLPIVATRVGGNPEVIEEGISGLLVPAKDPDRLAEAMEHLMAESPQVRLAMGTAARSRVESLYRLERVVDKWENIYEQLLQESELGRKNAPQPEGFLGRWRCNWR